MEIPRPHPAVGRDWELVLIVDGEEEIRPDQGSFTLRLEADGSARMRVDCNRGFGSYSLEGDSLSFGPMAVTLAYCGDGSPDHRFLRLIDGVRSLVLHKEGMTLVSEQGRLVFRLSGDGKG